MENYSFVVDYVLLGIGLLITIIAQIYVSSSYGKYKQKNTNSGLSGFEVARKILDKNGLKDVHIIEIRGKLTDHYDPSRKVVRLSKEIFNGTSIASNSIAAHECGHAIQDKDNYTFMRIRSMLVPVVNLSSKLGYIAIFIGLIFNLLNLAEIGILLLIAILIFQLITLPVEFDASKRAKIELKTLNILNNEELDGSNKMLKSAALTYVASLATTLLEIVRLILIISSRRD